MPPTFAAPARTIEYLTRALLPGVCVLAALMALTAARGPAAALPAGDLVQVVVELREPSLARDGRAQAIARQQDDAVRRIRDLAGAAQVRWRYRTVLNGFAVLVPAKAVPKLAGLPGVREVYPSVRFAPALERSVPAIKANQIWGAGLESSGQGMKIGIIDDGVDHTHPFFNPAGYAMPPGYPKGNAAFTNAKVIAARSFQAPSPRPRYSELPFDPENSEHGTHVAGIAAGNANTQASIGGGRVNLSGVAPRAYIGNYRVLTVPTISNVGLNGNSPEIAAGIEAAVQDGMNVINLSLGQPEISPGRDLVIRAIEGAAAAGVVSTIAAGNDFALYGQGSIASPGASPSAITAGAASVGARMAEFSASGPTPISLQLKPEVSAPGVSILSSVPASRGTWSGFSGTSMAAPHVAGAAALLKQRHPTWSALQLKSALTLTARPATDHAGAAKTPRQGAGFIDVAKADQTLVFAQPSTLGFGLLRRGRPVSRSLTITDAGGGAGDWAVRIERQGNGSGVQVTAPSRLIVPGTIDVRSAASGNAREGDTTGFVVLSRGGEVRRVPFWLRVTAPRLGRHSVRVLRKTGTYRGNTRGRKALVSVYRYPDDPTGIGVDRLLRGPEQVFRVTLRRPTANFGVAILGTSRVQPRIVNGRDENRQAGPVSLPLRVNPYLPSFFDPAPISGVIRPAAGTYHVVFDSPTRSGAGRFRFRFWLGDEQPPRLRLVTRSVRRGGTVVVAATDRGAGVDPGSVYYQVNGGDLRPASFGNGKVRFRTGGLRRGTHRLVVQVSDYQESKNTENALRILPNTATLRTTLTVR